VPDERLVEVAAAFIELHSGAEVEEQELIDYCKGKIASFKCPRPHPLPSVTGQLSAHQDPEVPFQGATREGTSGQKRRLRKLRGRSLGSYSAQEDDTT